MWVWEAGLTITADDPLGPTTTVRVGWTDAADESRYTYRLTWDAPAGDGGDFGELPADTDFLLRTAPCGATLTVDLVAWNAADVELGRTRAEGATGPCAVGPSNLSLSEPNELAVIAARWEPGSGYSHHVWEATVSDSGTSGVSAYTTTGDASLAASGAYINDFGCGLRIQFTLIAINHDGSELNRLRSTYETSPCPEVTIVRGTQFTVAAGTGNGRTAACPSGTTLIGGGFRTNGGSAAMPYPGWVYINAPIGDEWHASILAPPERDLTIQAYAICVGGVTASTQSTTMTIAAGGLRSTVAACPRSTIAASGGWNTTVGIPEVIVSELDTNGWRVTALNPNAEAITVQVRVRCIDHSALVQNPAITDSVADGDTERLTLSCPAAMVLTGGGFAGPDAHFEASRPLDDGSGWRVAAHNREFLTAGPAAVVEASAVCLRLR